VAIFLNESDVDADRFHAGLPPEEKKDIQQSFIEGRLRVIAATNAFGLGESDLASAEAEIEDLAPVEGPARAGEAAFAAFSRAHRIAALFDSVRRRQVTVERLLDGHEADLARLAEAAEVEPLRSDAGETTARIAEAISGLRADNERLGVELADERARTSELGSRLASLEDRLAEFERRFTGARDELLAVREREARLREPASWQANAPAGIAYPYDPDAAYRRGEVALLHSMIESVLEAGAEVELLPLPLHGYDLDHAELRRLIAGYGGKVRLFDLYGAVGVDFGPLWYDDGHVAISPVGRLTTALMARRLLRSAALFARPPAPDG